MNDKINPLSSLFAEEGRLKIVEQAHGVYDDVPCAKILASLEKTARVLESVPQAQAMLEAMSRRVEEMESAPRPTLRGQKLQ